MLGGLAPIAGGLGAPTWSAGDRPIWEYSAVRDLILARSLEGAPTRKSVAEGGTASQPLTLTNLTESLQLVWHSLRSLFESEAAASLKQVVGQVHACFERAVELSGGRNLMAKVLFAEYYARLVFDRPLHDRLLEEVVAADPEEPGLTLSNTLAQEQARQLLDDADDYF